MPSVWVDRDDTQPGACCGDAVADGEPLARLLNTEMWNVVDQVLTAATFPSDALKKPAAPNNKCGERDGESLLRCAQLADDVLRELSVEMFRGKARPDAGAAKTTAAVIRQIREPADPAQLFFVYEDPVDGRPEHAVVRFTDDPAHKPFFSIARRRLLQAFVHI